MIELEFDEKQHAWLKGYPYPDRGEMLALRTLGGLVSPEEEPDLDAEFLKMVEDLPPGFAHLEQAGASLAANSGILDAANEKWRLLQEVHPGFQEAPADSSLFFHQGLSVVLGSAVAIAARRTDQPAVDITVANQQLMEMLLYQEEPGAFPVGINLNTDAVTMNALVIDYDPSGAYTGYTTSPEPSRLGVFYEQWIDDKRQWLSSGGLTEPEWQDAERLLTAGMSTGFEFFQAADLFIKAR
jgi:hypothetical protein